MRRKTSLKELFTKESSMQVKVSLKFRTNGREEIRVRRHRKRMILAIKTSNKGGRLKVRAPIPYKRKLLFRKRRKY